MKRVFKRISEGLGETRRGVGEKLGGTGRNSEGLGEVGGMGVVG